MFDTIQKLRKKAAGRGEGGFSLIELLVVVLIIGILLAIAIPTFLNQRQKAQARDPQTALTNSLIAAKAYFTDNGDYAGLVYGPAATANSMAANEPAYGYIAAAAVNDTNKKTGGERTVAFLNVSNTVIRMWAKGDNGTCYIIQDDAANGTTYGSHAGDCVAAEPAVTASKF